MPNINLVVLGGNLARDPELRVTPNGTSICNFSIANNRKYKNAAGEEMQDVAFVDVEAWGKTGEVIAKYFAKGNPIIVRGRLKMDQWEDKASGAKRSKLKVTIMFPEGGFDFAGPTAGSNNQQDDQQQEEPPASTVRPQRQSGFAPRNTQPQRQQPTPQDGLEDDVPF